MARDDISIFVIPKVLSDGSKVYDVKLGDTVLNAVTETEADELATKMMDAINVHTNHSARRADRRIRRFAFVCGILALLYLCYAIRSLVL